MAKSRKKRGGRKSDGEPAAIARRGEDGPRGFWVVTAVLLFAVLWAIWMRVMEFGSDEGNWVYPYLRRPDVRAVLLGIVVATAAGFMAMRLPIRPRGIGQEVGLVVATFVVGVALEISVREFSPDSLASLVQSDTANGFYSAAVRTDVSALLGSFEQTLAGLPRHVQSNLPGKVLFYRSLLTVSHNPAVLGWLVIAISNLTAVFVYLLGRFLFTDRSVAWFAMVLCLFSPAKVLFQPILNVVSPVLVYAALVLWVASIQSLTRWLPLLCGAMLFAAFLIEPLPFALGLVFVALALQRVRETRSISQPLGSAVRITVGFLGCALLLYWWRGFDVLREFRFVTADAVNFNYTARRSYGVWVVQNVKEYFVGAGAAASFVAVTSLFFLPRLNWRESTEGRMGALTAGFFVTLAVLDLAGINRGEVTRLWIFLVPIQCLIVAYACSRWLGAKTSAVVAAGAILQIALCIGSVGFVIP